MSEGHSLTIITGGTKGFGRALTLAFARAGDEVWALFKSDHGAALDLASALRAEGLRGRCIQHDVCSDRPFVELPHDARLTLINNAAAPFVPKPLHLLSWKDFEDQLAVSLRGTFQASRSVLRAMITARHGTIVNVLSTVIDDLPSGFAAYATAKNAQLALTRALAVEYGSRGLRVFAVAPGFMDTPLTAAWHPMLREAIIRLSGVNDTANLAAQVVELVLRKDLPGAGEVYRLTDRPSGG